MSHYDEANHPDEAADSLSQERYEQLKYALLASADLIQKRKGPSYTRGTGDVLQNFRSAAAAAGITPEQAWVVFAKKQWDAICSLMVQPELDVAEPPIERFADLVNYLKLGFAMYEDRRSPDQGEKAPDSSPRGYVATPMLVGSDPQVANTRAERPHLGPNRRSAGD